MTCLRLRPMYSPVKDLPVMNMFQSQAHLHKPVNRKRKVPESERDGLSLDINMHNTCRSHQSMMVSSGSCSPLRF